MSESDDKSHPAAPEKPEEHLNIKVTDNNNEVFFKIKRTTALKKLMDAFCERQGRPPTSVRFLFDGSRVQPTDSPETVRHLSLLQTMLDEVDMILNSSTWRMETLLRFTKNKSVATT